MIIDRFRSVFGVAKIDDLLKSINLPSYRIQFFDHKPSLLHFIHGLIFAITQENTFTYLVIAPPSIMAVLRSVAEYVLATLTNDDKRYKPVVTPCCLYKWAYHFDGKDGRKCYEGGNNVPPELQKEFQVLVRVVAGEVAAAEDPSKEALERVSATCIRD